ncbi:MAG: HDOD domain-containing protein [Gammaproteobacteria bacterium]|nr:HDOD domain-containing protein [Gammaproteobacteria bacterium]
MADELETWIRRISEQDLPIFKYTATAISKGVENEDTSTAQLAQIILRDTSLTSRILRLANSVMYNPTRSPINTISRGILYLGFDLVRGISMSLAIIDAILKKRSREYVKQLMAKSFHGAALAQKLAEERGDDASEEVFIAALLYNIGEMAFWCTAEDKGEEILALMREQGMSARAAQKEILGFSFDQLTVGLTRDWHMSDLLHSSINNPTMFNPRIRDINLSKDLAESATVNWDSPKCQETILRISKHIDLNETRTRKLVQEHADEVAEIARQYGATEIISYLPISEDQKNTTDNDKIEIAEYPEPDPLLQLNILKDLTIALESKPTPNVILEIILEGLNRGVGLDRCLFALLTPDKAHIVGKFSIGTDNELFCRNFKFSIREQNIFSEILHSGHPRWVQNAHVGENIDLVTKDIRLVLVADSFMLFPVTINSKPIGLFYVDRQPSKRPLDLEAFSGFKHFGQQACMAIEHISARR